MAPTSRRSAVAARAAMAAAAVAGTTASDEVDEPDMEDLVQPKRVTKRIKKDAKLAIDTTAGATATHAPSDNTIQRHHASMHDFTENELRDVRTQLLYWYDAHRRKLPWRGDPPPYISTATHTKESIATTTNAASSSGTMDAFVAVTAVKTESQSLDSIPQATAPAALLLPRNVSPYETWVSEIMLQQTRVDTVVDYFLRWTDAFPTVEALANGTDEDVNRLWAGLGYYRRARMLHAGAKFVVEHFDGVLPSTVEQLLSIPGIGPYTAGAIASIAFNVNAPLVDGNVIRVVARLRAVAADPKNKQLIAFTWHSATQLVTNCERPGALNQALMELGATVCTTQTPACARCPVRSHCVAYEQTTTTLQQQRLLVGETDKEASCVLCDTSRFDEWSDAKRPVTTFPLRAKRIEQRNEVLSVAVVSCASSDTSGDGSDASDVTDVLTQWRFLMVKRPLGGLLAGQWEFLHHKVADGATIPSIDVRTQLVDAQLAAVFASSKALEVDRRVDLGELTHVFSHVKHHMGIEHVHYRTEPTLQAVLSPSQTTLRWMTTREMQQLGITTGVKKILRLVAAAAAIVGATSAKGSTGRAKGSSSRATANKPQRQSASAAPATKRVKTLTSYFHREEPSGA